MSKYVLNISQYINKNTLLTDILPLIDKKISINNDNIIEYLGIDNSSLHNHTINIQLFDRKNDIKSGLQTLRGKDSIYEINMSKLHNFGIDIENENISSLCKLISKVLSTNELLNVLNSMKFFSKQQVGELLFQYRIVVDDLVLDIFTNLLKQIYLDSITENVSGYNPMIRNSYYTENNYFVSKIKMENQSNIYSTIYAFSGEIYDSLDFKNKQESKEYQEQNHIKEDLLEDVVSILHFNCESNLSSWYNDLTILKYRTGCIYIDYGERLFVQNKENNVSITIEEIDAVIQEFNYRGINNDFITYAIRELKEFKKTILYRNCEYSKKINSVEEQCFETEILKNINSEMATSIINNSTYGDGKTVNVEITVTSDEPIKFTKNKICIKK